jgi:hypothetical protein
MYKKRITKWGFNKKLKKTDVDSIVKQQQFGKLQGQSSDVLVRGRSVPMHRLRRYLDRRPDLFQRVIGQNEAGFYTYYVHNQPNLSINGSLLRSSTSLRALENILQAARDYTRACLTGPNPVWIKTENSGCYSRKLSVLQEYRDSRFGATVDVGPKYSLEEIFDQIPHLLAAESPGLLRDMLGLSCRFTQSNRIELQRILSKYLAQMSNIKLGHSHPITLIWVTFTKTTECNVITSFQKVLEIILDEQLEFLGPCNFLTVSTLLESLHASRLLIEGDYGGKLDSLDKWLLKHQNRADLHKAPWLRLSMIRLAASQYCTQGRYDDAEDTLLALQRDKSFCRSLPIYPGLHALIRSALAEIRWYKGDFIYAEAAYRSAFQTPGLPAIDRAIYRQFLEDFISATRRKEESKSSLRNDIELSSNGPVFQLPEGPIFGSSETATGTQAMPSHEPDEGPDRLCLNVYQEQIRAQLMSKRRLTYYHFNHRPAPSA